MTDTQATAQAVLRDSERRLEQARKLLQNWVDNDESFGGELIWTELMQATKEWLGK